MALRNAHALRERLQKVERQLQQARRASARSKRSSEDDDDDAIYALEAERDELLRDIAKHEADE